MWKSKFLITLLSLFLLAGAALPAIAQQSTRLTLSQAVAIALEKNPVRKAAVAEQKASLADIHTARSAFMPNITLSENATRGNDPVYAFGTRLRQGRFTAADFALNQLNHPTPIGDFVTRFGGQWNLFDSFTSSLSFRRAKLMNAAAAQQLARVDQETLFRVINAYYGLLLAQKQVEVAEETMKTAQAVLDRSKARVEAGTVVESDALSAQVDVAARQQDAIRARNGVALARAQLNMALGVPAESVFEASEVLAERTLPTIALDDAEKNALKQRPDLKQIESQTNAQETGVKLAKAAFGPRVNAFGSWQMDNAAFAANGSNNWMAGAEIQFDLFSGGRKMAQLSHEKAMLERANAMKQAATDNVRLEVRQAFYNYDAARQMLEVSRASVAQAEESLRINQNRYDAGLTTITDLLRAEDAARAIRTNYWESVYGYQTSYAALELAAGSLNPQSPVVTQQ
jgi:outer membrane protein TolC